MIVVTGAAGQVGSEFVHSFGSEAVGLLRSDLDLTDTAAIRATLVKLRPSVIINCAAYTAVDEAEANETVARVVNAIAVGELARVAHDLSARFVTFSTDYVFDGEKLDPYVESDRTNPTGVYGRTKLEGERLAVDAEPNSLVIRTSWVMSGTHRSFLSTILESLVRGPVRVVDDQLGTPTLAADLVAATRSAIDAGSTGLVHMSNAEEMTWYDLAREIAEIADLDSAGVEPCTTDEFPRPAPRPKNSRLSSERLGGLGLDRLPSHRPALRRAVRQVMKDRV